MSLEIALYAAAIAAALVGIGALLKALRASRSQDYELFSDSEGGTGTDSEGGTGTISEGSTGTEAEPPAQQTSVIQLAFTALLVVYLLLLTHCNPSWQIIIKAGPGIGYILCQSMMAAWAPVRTGRSALSSILALWMLGMPFVQCQWWLFGVSLGTCTVSAVVLHHADLDQDIYRNGLAASLSAGWMAALTMLSTWSWASLLLTAPGMFGFYLVPVALKGLEGETERELQVALAQSALLSLYLIWSMPLPLLTSSASWQLLAAILFAGFGATALFIVSLVDQWSQGKQVHQIGECAAALTVATLLPLAVVWWSGDVPQLLETVPQWLLRLVPVTFGAIYIWMEVVYLSVGRPFSDPFDKEGNAFRRTDIVARALILLILLATPCALALDTAQLQQWGQIPDFYLPDYLTLQFGNQSWQNIQTWHLPNATWHLPRKNFLHMTQPIWPDLASATNSTSRAKFWLPFMAIKLMGTTVFAMLVLGIPCSKVQMQQDERVGDGRSQNQLKDVQRTSITICLVVANLALCTKLTLTASMAGKLTSGGMVWEGFDEVLSWGLLLLLAQAMALRLLNSDAVYAPFDVALSTLFVVPYLGDPFDTLKDALLASVAIQSDVLWLRYLGVAGLIYLWVLHLCILLPVKSSSLELQSSYLPVLLLKPTRTGSKFEHSMWVKFCTVIYKQTTPTRQKAMLAEDLPQALLACLVSMSSKGSMFTLITNIVMPLARLSFAIWYHNLLAETVKDWLLEQAVEAFCHERVEASNELAVAMSTLAQVTGKDDIWESDLLREAKARVDEKLKEVESLGVKVTSLEEAAIFPAYLQLQLALQGVEQGTEGSQSKALVNSLKIALKDPSLQGICSQMSTGCLPKLTAIKDLNFDGENISDEGAQLLADAISHLTAITKLHLSFKWCNMGSKGCKAIATAVSKLTNIQELELEFGVNNVGVEGAQALADAISRLRAIAKLNLDLPVCKITSEGCKAIATSLSKLTNIRELKLQFPDSNIGDEGAETFSRAISDLKAITKLHLSLQKCSMSSEGCKAIATALSKLTNLQELELYLGGNAIVDEGCRALAGRLPELQELGKLTLYLDFNDISSAAGTALEEAAAKLPRLTWKRIFIN